ncbi:hypothetical protein GW17_00008443 [Ensete ventricosum]|nr:hypothetical protein GW17_00008443 [Ensete ventricosum]
MPCDRTVPTVQHHHAFFLRTRATGPKTSTAEGGQRFMEDEETSGHSGLSRRARAARSGRRVPAHTKGHPHQFMSLVQRLTGKPSSSGSSRCSTTGSDSLRDLKQGDGTGEDGDTLLLTLGHFSSTPSVPSPVCVSKSVL